MSSGLERVERKLAAIFCADVADYSRLMGDDEVQTLRTLTAHRAIMDGLIAQHGGRIANTAGDSVLAEFPSVVDAVECAVVVQEKLGAANAGVPEDEALRFRIGVHVGDVMVRGGDLLGDGVNVAARVQSLAEPGGVWLSGRAYEQVEGKLSVGFEDRGEQQVKNIARPVRVYALAGVAPSRTETKPLPLPDKPSIAVLPFTNMSGPDDDYFCDGLVEDIITALSRVKWFFVIARNSSFTYKGRAVDVRQVGRELGVRYVLEGSVRRSGERLRVTAQLIESATGNHLWADRFDGAQSEVFEVQDRLTATVVGALEPSVRAAETKRAAGKRPEDLATYDLYLRALSELNSLTKEGYQHAHTLLREAVGRDQGYSDAWAALADCTARQTVLGWIADWSSGFREASHAAERAVATDPDNGTALSIAASTLAIAGRLTEAAELARRALQLHPNSCAVRTNCAWALIYNGEYDSALEHLDAARRLSPLDPRAYYTNAATVTAHLFAGRAEEAVKWAERTLERWPEHAVSLRYLAAGLASLGRVEEAGTAVRRLLAVQPTSTVTRAGLVVYRDASVKAAFLNNLRKAGLPE